MQPGNSTECKPVAEKESGNAIVEFVGIMVVIVVPALVLLVSLATTTMAQLALEDAARQAARTFVRMDSSALADVHARSVATQVWTTRGFSEPLNIAIQCAQSPCLTPGATVSVNVSSTVSIPVVGAVNISGSQDMVVDYYRAVRP